MKTIFSVVLFLILSQLAIAQNPDFEWAKQMGGNTNDYATSVTTDISGNVYTTGYFSGIVDFDPGVGTAYLTSAGNYDIFIQKLDASGNLLWIKQMSGTDGGFGFSITTDANGNVYTTGRFLGTIDFDPGAGTTNFTSLGLYDIYIQKLDSTGNLLWVKQIGGTSWDEGVSISTDVSGNVYTTGVFKGIVDFDPGAGTNNLTSSGAEDVFILKLDATGNLLYVKQMGGTSNDRGYSITTDANGNVYTTGYFNGTVDFDPGTGTLNLISAGNYDIYIQKLNSNGNFLWVKQMGGASYDWGKSITTDVSGNIYTTGSFEGTVDFDPGAGTSNLTSAGGYDIYIQKLDSVGNFLWVKQMGGTSADYGRSITTDTGGNVYTTGNFNGTVDFDPGVGIVNFTSAGSYDIFIQKLDIAGNLLWAKQMGGTSDDWGKSITTDACGNVYTTGYFKLTVDFEPGAGTTNLISAGSNDIFIQKLSQCMPTVGTDVITACDTYIWIDSVTYSTSNNTATHTLSNAGGCDSVVTLDLTVNYSNTGTDVITACDTYTWIDGNTYTASNNTATHTLSNAGGCDSVVTLDLTIDTVDISVIVADPSITANASGAAYQWLDCNNSFATIAGETAQSFTATANGDYAVEVIQNSCVDTSACITISTVGINEAQILNQISIYPNPTNGKINVDLGNLTNTTIKLYTLTGQIVYKKENITVPDFQFELSQIPGIYIIEISSQNKTQNYKLIIK